MPRRVRVALLLAAIAGCQAISSRPPQSAPPITSRVEKRATVHQAAYQQTSARPADLPPEPSAAPDHVSLAADCLERGDDAAAAGHLERHVGEHPDQVVFRARLADLLVRLDRLPAAQAHYEAAVAHAQDGPAAARRQLIHFHTRLMEIARLRDNAYAEHLHRGIGLYLVGCRLSEEGKPEEVERLMCKAAAALTEAEAARPDDARPAWYLSCVWSHLDQPRPADRALRKASAAAPFSRLTPAEARELALARRAMVSGR
jgi:hypothetical protein